MLIKINKKAMALYYPVMWGFLIGLSIFWFLNAHYNSPKNTEFVGQVFLDSYKEIQNSFNDIYYIKQSAKYSAYNAIYPFTKKGFYFENPRCLISDAYMMWENIIEGKETPCYPTEIDIKINFALFLNEELNKYFETYKATTIPKNNYDFILKEEKETTKINGFPTQNIIGTSNWANYSFKPSFETETPYKIITKSEEYSNKAQEIKDNIQNCLTQGSNTPDDKEDLLTCSDIDKLKKEIEEIENYQIIPIVFPKNYTILFDIEDPSFKNPYSDEKLNLKFGIRFLDTFSPPVTEIIGIEDSKLKWKKNNASDVIKYSIYARKLQPTIVAERDFITTIGKETEWKIEYDSDCTQKEKEDKICLKEGEKYWFYIIAIDNADNTAETIIPTELTI